MAGLAVLAIAGGSKRTPRIVLILSAWLSIINGMSKLASCLPPIFLLINDNLGLAIRFIPFVVRKDI